MKTNRAENSVDVQRLSRRHALGLLGIGIPAVAAGCTTIVFPDASMSDAPGTDAGTGDNDAFASASDAATAITDAGSAEGWATGGTAAITALATYPNPFATPPEACNSLTVSATLGPCYFEDPATGVVQERVDVSEGYPGLPVRLALRVVNTSCTPIANARVEIWHTRNTGLYSGGPTSMCTTGDADAIAHQYFRGAQITDADGVVYFNTCFPGWYRGRAVHIHFQVFTGSGAASVVSQIFFPTALNNELFDTHPEYAFGRPDTSNETDMIYAGVGTTGLADYARMSDGAMLASKQIIIR